MLRAQAAVVTQRDYERAVRWEIRDSIAGRTHDGSL